MLDFEKKPVIAMLHLAGHSDEDIMERMIRETEIYFRNGVDAVMVENYFGSIRSCVQAIEYLSKYMPDKSYGVNILGDYRMAHSLAEAYNADFVQIDSVCGHLNRFCDKDFERELLSVTHNRSYKLLGGLRFKYQPVLSGRTLIEDAELAKRRCDAVVTTGVATGAECPTDKLIEFRDALGCSPLLVGAGVTAENVGEKLKYADGVIIGSWLKHGHRDYGEVCEEYVKIFMDKVISIR